MTVLNWPTPRFKMFLSLSTINTHIKKKTNEIVFYQNKENLVIFSWLFRVQLMLCVFFHHLWWLVWLWRWRWLPVNDFLNKITNWISETLAHPKIKDDQLLILSFHCNDLVLIVLIVCFLIKTILLIVDWMKSYTNKVIKQFNG